jgi:hypothetical protein
MAVEQSFTLSNQIGSTLVSLNKVEINLTGGGTNVRFDSDDPEVSFSLTAPNTYTIELTTLEGNAQTTGTLTLFFTLSGGELCEKTVSFTPVTFDCPPSAISGNETYAAFVKNQVNSDGKIQLNLDEDCLVFVKTN